MKYLNILASIILGFFGLYISHKYSKSSQKLQDDLLMKELFEKFNERYDSLNDQIQIVMDAELSNNIQKENLSSFKIEKNNKTYKQVLIDYFNLCAEEYFWHKKGRVDPLVWKSWNAGMKYWYNKSQLFRDFWTQEKEDNNYISYYLEDSENDFFKIKLKK